MHTQKNKYKIAYKHRKAIIVRMTFKKVKTILQYNAQ